MLPTVERSDQKVRPPLNLSTLDRRLDQLARRSLELLDSLVDRHQSTDSNGSCNNKGDDRALLGEDHLEMVDKFGANVRRHYVDEAIPDCKSHVNTVNEHVLHCGGGRREDDAGGRGCNSHSGLHAAYQQERREDEAATDTYKASQETCDKGHRLVHNDLGQRPTLVDEIFGEVATNKHADGDRECQHGSHIPECSAFVGQPLLHMIAEEHLQDWVLAGRISVGLDTSRESIKAEAHVMPQDTAHDAEEEKSPKHNITGDPLHRLVR